MADIKRRAPHYVSDWTDAFLPANRGRCLSSVAFLFFACLAPAIAFGALFAEYTNDQLGATEMILSSAISGVAYAFLSGQPLCILGATGTCPSARSRVPQNERRFSSQPLFSFHSPLHFPYESIDAGPELAYTVVFYNMCQKFGVEFLPARVWQGLWTALFTCLLSCFDASALMNRVTYVHCNSRTGQLV